MGIGDWRLWAVLAGSVLAACIIAMTGARVTVRRQLARPNAAERRRYRCRARCAGSDAPGWFAIVVATTMLVWFGLAWFTSTALAADNRRSHGRDRRDRC